MNLVNRFKEHFLLHHFLDKSARSIADNRALIQIKPLFPDNFILPFTSFSLNPNTILHVLNEIQLNKRSVYVEFGSGISTIIIARYIHLNGLPCKIVSIDDNLDWLNEIASLTRKYSPDTVVDFVHAPFTNYSSKNHEGIWYDLNTVVKSIRDLRVDLVVVDGPGGSICENARFPAIEVLKESLASSYTVFLDDIRRKDEQYILREWMNLLSEGQPLTVLNNKKDVYATLSRGKLFSCYPLSH